MDPREILLSHLPFSADAKVVYDLVTPFGPIETMQPRIDPQQCLRVTFKTQDSARAAVAALHGRTLFNTRIHAVGACEADAEPVWAGFLCKSQKDRCLVDVLQVKGDCETPLRRVHQLKVTHRARLEDIRKVAPFAVGIVTAGDAGQGVTRFVEYLRRKDRAGFVQGKGFCVYLVPKGMGTEDLGVDFRQDQLLALIVAART